MTEENGIWLYAPSQPATSELRAKGGGSVESSLRRVSLDDEQIAGLRAQVDRIAASLESHEDQDRGFHVDSITAHIGISASGKFFFIAEAGVEASLEITWSRSGGG